MIRVEFLRNQNTGMIYRIKCNELELYMPKTEEIVKVIEDARSKNIIQYIERRVNDAEQKSLYTFMLGFKGIVQNEPILRVLEKVGKHIVQWGKATPEKRRYSIVAIPRIGIQEFNLEESKIPCIRISCNAKGQDMKAYAKYLEIKDGMMTLVDAKEELDVLKGIMLLIKPMNSSIVAMRA